MFIGQLNSHSDNYITANPLVTPESIVPEWYFLFAYAILRSIPHKLGGVLALLGSLLVLFILPHVHTSLIRSHQFRPLSKIFFYIFVANFILLTYLGQCHVETPWIELGRISTIIYFGYFIILVPLIGKIENYLFFYKVSSSPLPLLPSQSASRRFGKS